MTTLRSVQTWFRVILRLLRARRRWLAAGPSLVVAAGLVLSFLSLNSLSLSPDQILQRDMGRFQASIGFGSQPVTPGDPATLPRISRGLEAAAPGPVFVSLSMVGVRVDGESTVVREGAWHQRPFPERYALQTGRWASTAGEVVVVRGYGAQDGAPAPGGDLELLSGRLDLEVVGVATDRFSRESTSLLVGPGTWAEAPASTARAFPAVAAYPVVYWNGGRRAAVTAALTDVLSAGDPGQSQGDLRESVESSILDAPTLIGTNPDRWVAENPAGYTIPSLGLPLLGVAIAFSVSFTRTRRTARTLHENGASVRWAATAAGGALVTTTLTASVVGCVAGWLLALAARSALAQVHNQPLAPLETPTDPVVRILAGALVAGLAGCLTLLASTRQTRDKSPGSPRGARSRMRDARHVGAILAAGAAVFMLRLVTAPPQAMILAAVCAVVLVLMAPEFLRLGCRLLPDGEARTRLARRQLEGNPFAPVSVAVTAFVIAGSVGFTALLSTMIATVDGRQIPDVLPGQVLVADRATPIVPPPSAVTRLIEGSAAFADADRVPLAFATHGIEGEKGSRTVSVRGASGYVMVVDSIDDARSLLGSHWRASYAQMLLAGGLLRWSDSAEATTELPGQTELVVSDEPERTAASLESLEVASPRVGWKQGKSSLTLRSTLTEIDLPISDGAVLFTNVTPQQTRELHRELSEAGLDPSTVVGFREPSAPIPPVGLVATAVALSLICLLVVGLESGARARSLRESLSRLVAVGVSPGWAHQVLMSQQAVVSVVGAVLGAVGGVLPLIVAAQLMSGQWELQLPWAQIAVLMGACLAGTGLATWLGARRLTAAGVT